MRAFQFWILLFGSSFVSVLLIKQIFLNRAIFREQRELVDCQETVSQGSGFENAWKQLALHVYQAGTQDPALSELLTKEGIEIHPNAPAPGAPPSAPAPSAPPTTIKPPVAPVHPVNP